MYIISIILKSGLGESKKSPIIYLLYMMNETQTKITATPS